MSNYLRGCQEVVDNCYVEYNDSHNDVVYGNMIDSIIIIGKGTWFNYKGISGDSRYLFKTDKANSILVDHGVHWQIPDNLEVMHPDSVKSAFVRAVQGRDPNNKFSNGGSLIGAGVGAEYKIIDSEFTKYNSQSFIVAKELSLGLNNIFKISVEDSVRAEYYSIPFAIKLFGEGFFIEFEGVLSAYQSGVTFVDKVQYIEKIKYNINDNDPVIISSVTGSSIYLQIECYQRLFTVRAEVGSVSAMNVFNIRSIEKL